MFLSGNRSFGLSVQTVDEKVKVKCEELKIRPDESHCEQEVDVLVKESADCEVTKRSVSRRILRDDLREKTEEKREEARVKKEEKEDSRTKKDDSDELLAKREGKQGDSLCTVFDLYISLNHSCVGLIECLGE